MTLSSARTVRVCRFHFPFCGRRPSLPLCIVASTRLLFAKLYRQPSVVTSSLSCRSGTNGPWLMGPSLLHSLRHVLLLLTSFLYACFPNWLLPPRYLVSGSWFAKDIFTNRGLSQVRESAAFLNSSSGWSRSSQSLSFRFCLSFRLVSFLSFSDWERSTHFAMLVIFISFLGIEAKRTSTSLVLIQTKYTLDLLTRTHMQDSKPCPTPLASGSKLSAYDGAPLSDATESRSIVGARSLISLRLLVC